MRTRRAVAALVAAVAAVAACGTTGSPLPSPARPLPPAAEVTTGRQAASVDPTASAGPTAPRPQPQPQPLQPSPSPPCNERESVPPLAALPPPRARGSRIDAIERYGYLRVGITVDAPPFGSMNWRTMEVEGFDVDVAREIARALFGRPDRVQFRAVDTRDRESLLAEGKADIVVATMTMTCERKEKVRFSGVYYEAGMRLLVPADTGFDSVTDLAGRQVCSSQGSTSFQKIADLVAGGRRPIPVHRVGAVDCLAALQRGEVDAVATDDTILAGMGTEDATLKLLGPEAFDGVLPPERRGVLAEPYGVAIARTDDDRGLSPSEAAANRAADDEFVRFVNRVLLDMMTGPRWNELYDRYLLGVLGPAGDPPARRQRGWPDGVLTASRGR